MPKEKTALFRSAEEKRELINSHKNSKQSISHFCEGRGLAPTTLSGWLAKEKSHLSLKITLGRLLVLTYERV